MSAASTWHILGAGALGGLLAARLQLAGAAPMLILRDDATAAAARTAGITLFDGTTATTSPVSVATLTELNLCSPARLQGPVNRLILCTKAHHSLTALRSLGDQLSPTAHVLLMQNGMGVREQLLAQWPELTILHGVTTEAAWRRGRFEIVHAAHGQTLLAGVGTVTAGQHAVLEQLASLFNRAGIAAQVVADCRPALWEKLVVNSVINPLTALHRCRNGELADIPGVAEQVRALCEEAAAVAQASGVPLQTAALEARVLQVRDATAANRSSMLQDVLAGRTTEIDFINGYIVREAERYGLVVPVQRGMWQAVAALTRAVDATDSAP